MISSVIIFLLASCCIFNYLQQNKLKKDIYTDQLTGLYNRKYLKKIDKLEKAGESFFIVACDIDHFKKVNDTYGHATGDIVLKTIGLTLKSYFKTNDHVIRFGGEEFFVFVKQNGTLTETILKDRINGLREKIEQLEILSNNMTLIKITSSFGICYDTSISVKDRIDKADKKLYQAKESGRNIVII